MLCLPISSPTSGRVHRKTRTRATAWGSARCRPQKMASSWPGRHLQTGHFGRRAGKIYLASTACRLLSTLLLRCDCPALLHYCDGEPISAEQLPGSRAFLARRARPRQNPPPRTFLARQCPLIYNSSRQPSANIVDCRAIPRLLFSDAPAVALLLLFRQ